MNISELSTQLLYTTVPVWVEYKNKNQGFGTGSIFMLPAQDSSQGGFPLLITNYHVVQNSKRVLIEFAERSGDQPKRGKGTRIELDGELLRKYVDRENDLSAIPIAAVLTQLENIERPAFFRSISPDLVPSREVIDSLPAIEEITFIGYPSGLRDEQNFTPIVRRGITATPVWNDFQGQNTFLIDAGVFPGSSGSPVFLFNEGSYGNSRGLVLGNRLYFLGILSESIVRREQANANIFLGLGKVIKSHVVQDFVKSVVEGFGD